MPLQGEESINEAKYTTQKLNIEDLMHVDSLCNGEGDDVVCLDS